MKHLADGSYAFALFNLSDNNNEWLTFWLPDIGLSSRDGYVFRLYDIEPGEFFGEFDDMVKGEHLGPHECKVFRGQLVKKS